MSSLWLKAQTRKLIAACGGLEESSRACRDGCRNYSVQQLSRCQTPGAPDLLPIDIVACLESYCGEPHVSRAMFDARPAAVASGELREEAGDVIEAAGALFARIRAAQADGKVCRREAAEIAALLESLKTETREAEAALAAMVEGGS